MKHLILHEEAERELRESVNFYERAGGGKLSRGFEASLRSAFLVIAEYPERFPKVVLCPKVQKCRISRFPFSIYYLEQKETVWILALAHHKRYPGYWQHRLR